MESVQFYDPTAVSSFSTSKPAGKPSTEVCKVVDNEQGATPLQTLGLGVLNAPASKPSDTPCDKPVYEPIDKTATLTAQLNKLESDNFIQTRSSKPIFRFPPGFLAEQPANVPATKKGPAKFQDKDDFRTTITARPILNPVYLESLPSQPVEQGDLKTLAGEQGFSQQTGIPKHRRSTLGNMNSTGPERTMRSRDRTSKPDNESPKKAVAGKRTSSKRKTNVEVHRPKRSRMARRTVSSEDSGDETEAFSSDNPVYHDLMPNQLKDSIEGPGIRRDNVIADKVAKVKESVDFILAEEHGDKAQAEKLEWEIEKILDKRETISGTEYKVRWKDTWLLKDELINARKLLWAFKARRRAQHGYKQGRPIRIYQA
ncbi:hypothetical protein MMC17_009526 [Xylographa soralifera]|nr:hypothetical protein [Xylographa soralifera]